jgi:hypothetical protein
MARTEMGCAASSDGRVIVKRADVTYGQLDRVLRALGFSCRLVTEVPPARVYEHPESGAWILVPFFPEDDLVLDYHLANVRNTLDGFGIAAPKVFEAKLQKAS